MLNMLQVAKRKRELTLDEVRYLINLTESDTANREVKVGAYILLGNSIATQVHLEKMGKEEQQRFKEYPIYHLINQN